MKQILIIIFLISFKLGLRAQELENTSANELNDIEEVCFLTPEKNTKKILKKWKKYENISKVYIDETASVEFIDFILKEVSKNKNIDELTISLNNNTTILLNKYDLSHITSLKIYNSANLNQKELLNNKSLLKHLQSFTWINNHQKIDTLILRQFKNLTKIEMIDTIVNFSHDSILHQISKIKTLTELTISFKNEKFTYDLRKIKELRSLSLINIEKYKEDFKTREFLNLDETNSHTINEGNKEPKINYYNNDTVLYKNERRFIIKNFNLNTLEKAVPCEGIEFIFKNDITYKNITAINTDTIYKPYFKRPISTLQISPYYLKIDNNKDTNIVLESGTKISILKNSFVNEKGEVINKNLTLIYREFADPISIFASGIPMNTTFNGKKETLSSAGMFEIRVFQNKKELQIKSGQTINIEFASIDDGKNYNFCNFDINKKEWVDENKKLEISDIDCDFIKNNRAQNNLLLKPNVQFSKNINFDTTSFNNRFNNFDYYYLCDKNFKKQTILYEDGFWVRNKKIRNFKIYNNKISKRKNLVKFTFVPKTKNDSSVFVKINLKTNQMKLFFPELAYFNHITFYNDEFIKSKQFKSKYFKNKMYSDIRVEYKKGDDHCVFILKDKKEYIRIEMNLYDEFVTKPIKQRYYKNTFYRAYLKYKRKLGEREESYNMSLKIQFINKLREQPQNLLKIENDTNRNKVVVWMKPINASRKVELVKTGFYNCDVVYENVLAKVYNLELKDKENKTIKFNTIYIFDENANTYFNYNTSNVVLEPKTLMGIIVTTESGEIYYINKYDLPTINFDTEKVEIIMNKNIEKINSLNKACKLFLKS